MIGENMATKKDLNKIYNLLTQLLNQQSPEHKLTRLISGGQSDFFGEQKILCFFQERESKKTKKLN